MRRLITIVVMLSVLLALPLVLSEGEVEVIVKPERVYALEPVKITIVVRADGKPVKNAVVVITPETGGLYINGSREPVVLVTDEKGEAKTTIVVNRCGVLEVTVGGTPEVEATTYIFVFLREIPLVDYAAIVLNALLIFVPLALFLYIGPIKASRRRHEE